MFSWIVFIAILGLAVARFPVRALHCELCGREGALKTRMVPRGLPAVSVFSHSVDGPGRFAEKAGRQDLSEGLEAASVGCPRQGPGA